MTIAQAVDLTTELQENWEELKETLLENGGYLPKKRISLPDMELLSLGLTAETLHVHTTTLKRWSSMGVIKHYYVGRRNHRWFDEREVLVLKERLLEGKL